MKEAVIAGYIRSPFHFASKGDLAKVRPDDLTAAVVKALIAKTGIDAKEIEDLLLGCAFPEGEQGLNVARLIALIADLPQSVAGATINRFCGSSMQAIPSAAGAIAIGAGGVFICAVVESMSRVPMMGFNPMPNPALNERLPAAYISMGTTAENVAKKYAISRAEQEAFAVESQAKATAARQAGKLTEEITPIQNGKDQVVSDGCIREGTTLEALAGLKPAFAEKGVVTAGTSSPLTDGAAACLVTSAEFAKAHGLKVLAKVKSVAVAGCAPEIMGIGPVAASKQALACMRDLKTDPKKVNLDGGAIALGHPLGATGARITGKAAALLKREGKQFALSTQCIGGGQGIATILEAV